MPTVPLPAIGSALWCLHGALQYHIVNSMGWTGLRSTQADAVGPILEGKHCLILAPTAGGKRIEAYARQPIQRIGLSATVGNPVELVEWFAGAGERQIVGSSSVSTDADVTIDHVGSIADND